MRSYLVRYGETASFHNIVNSYKNDNYPAVYSLQYTRSQFSSKLRTIYNSYVLQTFVNLPRETFAYEIIETLDRDIITFFVKSGFVLGGFNPTLRNNDIVQNVINIPRNKICQ